MGNQERDPPGGEGEGEVVKHVEDHGKGKGLIGKKVIKEQAHGEIVDYDEETHDYKVKFSDDDTEELKWSEVKDWLAPEISFKRFPQKKKESLPEDGEQITAPDDNLPSSDDEEEEPATEAEAGEAENASETEASFHDAETEIKPENSDEENEEEDEEEEPLTNSHRKKEEPLQKPTGTEVTRNTADAEKKSPERNGSELKKKQNTPEPEPEPESEPESEPGPEEHEDEDEDEEGSSGDEEEEEPGGESDSSINESDLEMITRKRKKKKRKHVLTLQRWRGYKKKRKLAAEAKKAALAAEDPEAAAALDLVVTDAMEEVAPRKKSRTRKLAEVDEIQRKRQKIAMELKKKLEARSKSKKRKGGGGGGGGVEEEVEEEAVMKVTPLAAARHLDGDEIKVSPYSDSKPSPFDRGIKLRGRKLRKIFKGKVARGEIADYDRRTRFYKVRYEDGEVEKLMWKHVEPMLVPFEQLHTWDDPDSETLASVLAAEKQQAKEKAANKTPKLKPLTLK